MNNAGNSTHKARAIEMDRFRNQATGIGQTRSASECTGAIRAQHAINDAPNAQRKVADPSYPAPTRDENGEYIPQVLGGTGALMSPVQLKRAGR